MIDVATLAEMCQILKIDHTTGAKHRRKWPHFFATDGRDKIEPRIEPQKKAPPFLTGQTLFLLALFEPRRVAHGVVVNPAEDYPREDDPHNHRKAS